MSWRTVVISKRSKLDMRNGYLVVRTEDDVKRINLDEISVLIIENSAVSITGCLIVAMSEKKIKVIFVMKKEIPHVNLFLIMAVMIRRQRSNGRYSGAMISKLVRGLR